MLFKTYNRWIQFKIYKMSNKIKIFCKMISKKAVVNKVKWYFLSCTLKNIFLRNNHIFILKHWQENSDRFKKMGNILSIIVIMMRRMIQINTITKMTSLLISNRLRKTINLIKYKDRLNKSNKILLIINKRLKINWKPN